MDIDDPIFSIDTKAHTLDINQIDRDINTYKINEHINDLLEQKAISPKPTKRYRSREEIAKNVREMQLAIDDIINYTFNAARYYNNTLHITFIHRLFSVIMSPSDEMINKDMVQVYHRVRILEHKVKIVTGYDVLTIMRMYLSIPGFIDNLKLQSIIPKTHTYLTDRVYKFLVYQLKELVVSQRSLLEDCLKKSISPVMREKIQTCIDEFSTLRSIYLHEYRELRVHKPRPFVETFCHALRIIISFTTSTEAWKKKSNALYNQALWPEWLTSYISTVESVAIKSCM
jgi:hypothetical protein